MTIDKGCNPGRDEDLLSIIETLQRTNELLLKIIEKLDDTFLVEVLNTIDVNTE